jgi:hypothetical protein
MKSTNNHNTQQDKINKIFLFTLLIFTLLISGCARFEWVHPNIPKGSEQIWIDKNLCEQKALASPITRSNIECAAWSDGHCRQYVSRTYSDYNRDLFRACMHGKGYRMQEVIE